MAVIKGFQVLANKWLLPVIWKVKNQRQLIQVSERNYCRIKLGEVGKLERPRLDANYSIGQMFLHRVFGYRGVVLFPYMAKLYDRDAINSKAEEQMKGERREATAFSHLAREVKGKPILYYHVLIDTRDVPFVGRQTQTDSVTFVSNHTHTELLYSLPNMDHVVHEDMLPYSPTEEIHFQHALLDKFLLKCPGRNPPFLAKDALIVWRAKNLPWLELADVHKETTENIRVTAIPFYVGARVSTARDNSYWWRYCIRIENLNAKVTALRERHWKIFSLTGCLETMHGLGVAGIEPVLSNETPAFQYSSLVSLKAPSGHMWGTFLMEREDGSTFECRIPPFSLNSDETKE